MTPLSRRQLLGRGGALAGLAWLSLTLFGHRPLPALSAEALGAAGITTLQSALEALLPDDVPAESIASGVDSFLAGGDPFDAEQLRMALTVLEHAAAPGLYWRRFSRLSLEERRAALGRWERSSIALFRQIFQALRRLALYAWYADPRSWDSIGYDGPWVKA